MNTAEERINKLEDRSLEIMQTDTHKKSEKKREIPAPKRAMGQFQMI